MIFQHTWPLILSGIKTQTRRLTNAKDQEIRGRYNRIEAVLSNGRVKWRVGKLYAVQIGRGKSQIARIEITSINSEIVSRITNAGAIKEGFQSRNEFFELWKTMHGVESLKSRVWVVTFQLAPL